VAKVSPIKNSFNAGEFSPRLEGRPDLKKYDGAVRTGINVIGSVQGDIINRSGTVYVADTKTSSEKSRLISFEFSTEQAYIIEAGNLYMRFYRNQTQITGGAFSDVFAPAFKDDIVIEIVTPYLEADLFELKFSQSADILYITHPDYAPRKVGRTSNQVWSISEIDFLDGPFLATNATDTTINPSGTTGSITLTASSIVGINGGAGFKSTDVGRLFRFKDSATNWTWLEITGFTSTTVVTALVRGDDLATTGAGADWREGVWSDTTGYPSASTFFEDRLWFGGGKDYSQRINGSRTGDYENHSPTDPDGTVLDDSGISFTLNANNVNAIQWLQDDEKGLLVGTVGGEWILRASSLQEAVTPSNVQGKRSSTYGSADLMPVRAGKAVLFVQRAKRKLREMAYLFEADGFEAPDMTLFSDHITTGGMNELAYQQEPQSVIWVVRDDGVLLSFTYERPQDVLGWYRHSIGGTDAKVESVATIPSSDQSRTELWAIVSRTINGATKRYVEYMAPTFDMDTDPEDAFFVDAGLTYSGASATTLTGLDHLEGESVTILSEGATHPNKTVSGGSITLDRATTKAHVGLGYVSDIELLRFDVGAQDGTSQGKTQRYHEVKLRVLRTLGGKVGPSFTELDRIYYRDGADLMDTAVPLFTGDLEQEWDSEYSSNETVCIRQDQPLPFWLLAVMPKMRTYDG
jgi:hypothetical protein